MGRRLEEAALSACTGGTQRCTTRQIKTWKKENRINRRESWMNQNYDVDPHPPTHWNPTGIEFRHQLRNAANIKLLFAWYPQMRWRRHPTLCGRHSTTAPFFDYFVNSYISSDGEEGSRDADIITEGKDFVHDSEWVFLSPLTGIEIRHASLFRSTTPHGLCACVQYRENKRITTTGSDCYYAANRRHACQHPPPTKKTTQENCWYTRQEDALKVGNVMVHPCWFYANFKTLKESHSLEAVYGQNTTVPTKQGWRVNIKCVSDEENLFLVVGRWQQQHTKNGRLWTNQDDRLAIVATNENEWVVGR